MGARLYSPAHIVAIDKADTRLEAAKQFGADVTVNNDREDPGEVIAGLTDGLGADVAVEAVGVPATFELSARLIRPGGRVANIGVHGEPATLHLEDLWIRDVTITTGLVDTFSTPTLLKLATSRQLDASRFVTHHFALDDFVAAYDVFGRADETGALKVCGPGADRGDRRASPPAGDRPAPSRHSTGVLEHARRRAPRRSAMTQRDQCPYWTLPPVGHHRGVTADRLRRPRTHRPAGQPSWRRAAGEPMQERRSSCSFDM